MDDDFFVKIYVHQKIYCQLDKLDILNFVLSPDKELHRFQKLKAFNSANISKEKFKNIIEEQKSLIILIEMIQTN